MNRKEILDYIWYSYITDSKTGAVHSLPIVNYPEKADLIDWDRHTRHLNLNQSHLQIKMPYASGISLTTGDNCYIKLNQYCNISCGNDCIVRCNSPVEFIKIGYNCDIDTNPQNQNNLSDTVHFQNIKEAYYKVLNKSNILTLHPVAYNKSYIGYNIKTSYNISTPMNNNAFKIFRLFNNGQIANLMTGK